MISLEGKPPKSVLFIDKDIQVFTAEDIQGVQFIDKDIQESSCSLTMISSNVLLTDKDIQENTFDWQGSFKVTKF